MTGDARRERLIGYARSEMSTPWEGEQLGAVAQALGTSVFEIRQEIAMRDAADRLAEAARRAELGAAGERIAAMGRRS